MESVHKLVISRTNVGLHNGLSHRGVLWVALLWIFSGATGGHLDAARHPGKAPVVRSGSDPIRTGSGRWNDRDPFERHLFEGEVRSVGSRRLYPNDRGRPWRR